jgi:hypothetical protein
MSGKFITKAYAMGERRSKVITLKDGTKVRIIIVSGKRRDEYMSSAMAVRERVKSDGINMEDEAAVVVHLRTKYTDVMNDIIYQFMADCVCGETLEEQFSIEEMRAFPNDLSDELWDYVQAVNRLAPPKVEGKDNTKPEVATQVGADFFGPKSTETGSDLPAS